MIGLSGSDYVVRGGVSGQLFGTPYNVGYFAPASTSRIVPGNGRILTNREGYGREALNLDLTLRGRAGPRVEWQAWGSAMDWRELFTDRALAIQDPTSTDSEPLPVPATHGFASCAAGPSTSSSRRVPGSLTSDQITVPSRASPHST